MSARYAIYYAPRHDDPLSILAGQWLGRDAFSGEILAQPVLAELADIDLKAVTADPRHYGFHATLKAPFHLRSEQTEAALMAALLDFCGSRTAFAADIAPHSISHFMAFRLTGPTDEMQSLHEACVREFEPFRAPLSDGDIARRRKAPLSTIQDERLLSFGYPYIFDDFRFHMTLTGAIKEQDLRDRLIGVLQSYFSGFTGPHTFWGLSLFKQVNRESPFTIIQQAAFGGNGPSLISEIDPARLSA